MYCPQKKLQVINEKVKQFVSEMKTLNLSQLKNKTFQKRHQSQHIFALYFRLLLNRKKAVLTIHALTVVPPVAPATPETPRGAFNKREKTRLLQDLIENNDVDETANPDETTSQPATQGEDLPTNILKAGMISTATKADDLPPSSVNKTTQTRKYKQRIPKNIVKQLDCKHLWIPHLQ